MTDWLLILLNQLILLILLAVSFNLTAGYLGYINMATASIYGLGAFITAILMTHYELTFFATIPLSLLGGVLIGVVVGLPSLRVRSIYYLIVSIGFQLLCHDIFKNSALTGDKQGIKDIPSPSLFGINITSPFEFCLLGLFFLGFVMLFAWGLTNSPFGLLMRGVRDNELLVRTLGKGVKRVKLITFSFSGAVGALAGSLHAAQFRFVSYEAFGLDISLTILVIVTIGGMGWFWGPVAGAVFVMSVPEFLKYLPLNDAQIALINRILYGIIILILLRYSPGGLIEVFKKITAHFRTKPIHYIKRENS